MTCCICGKPVEDIIYDVEGKDRYFCGDCWEEWQEELKSDYEDESD